MGFIGERQRKTSCKKFSSGLLSRTFKNIYFIKVFEIPKNFLQKVLWWGAGVKPLPYKPKFRKETHREAYSRSG